MMHGVGIFFIIMRVSPYDVYLYEKYNIDVLYINESKNKQK